SWHRPTTDRGSSPGSGGEEAEAGDLLPARPLDLRQEPVDPGHGEDPFRAVPYDPPTRDRILGVGGGVEGFGYSQRGGDRKLRCRRRLLGDTLDLEQVALVALISPGHDSLVRSHDDLRSGSGGDTTYCTRPPGVPAPLPVLAAVPRGSGPLANVERVPGEGK